MHSSLQYTVLRNQFSQNNKYLCYFLIFNSNVYREWGKGAKRTAFLCNSVALAQQQFDVLKKSTNLKVKMYVGSSGVDFWKRSDWDKEFRETQVLVCTTQVLLDCIRQQHASLRDFNLLVFDECHHATGNHAMHQLMQQFQNENQSLLPRVIGLTGVLIKSSKESQILDDLNKLEAVFRGKIVTVENIDEYKNVLIYSTSPKELIVSWQATTSTSNGICGKIKTMVAGMVASLDSLKDNTFHRKMSKNMGAFRPPSAIQKIKSLLLDFLYHLEELGLYAASLSIDFIIIELEYKKRSGETDYFREYANKTINVCKWIKDLLVESIYGSNSSNVQRSAQEERRAILNNCTPKLSSLLEYLRNELKNKYYRDIKCLIFVLRRYTTKVLHFIINTYSGNNMDYMPLKTQFMVGRNQGLPESMDNLSDDKREKDVMTSFRQSDVNCIVCSSVLEEGIDVQECNYVIMFDELKSFTTYVQTKGRARMQNSFYIIFNSNDKEVHDKLIKKLEKFRNMDELLKKYFIDRTIDRHATTPKKFYSVVEPYVSKIGAKLEADNVLSLLYRYFNCLPNDNYTNPEAMVWKKVDVDRGCQVSLQLPMQSTVKETIIVSILLFSNCLVWFCVVPLTYYGCYPFVMV